MIKLIALTILLALSVNAQDVEDIIEDVQETYEDMTDMSATFKRVESFKLTGTVSETVGRIYIKDGEKYRFESDDQMIVTNGQTVWTYNAINKQVIVDNVRKDSGALLPRDMLFKYPKEYYSTLLGEDEIDGQNVYIIKLDPKEDVHGYIKSMKIWVEEDDSYIIKLETTDQNGNKSTFEITDLKVDQDLKDTFFTFQAEEGVNVVDMRH